MSKYLLRFAAILALATSAIAPARAIQSSQDATSSALDKVFQASEHQEVPWKVNFSQPRLMFQQIYLVEVRARVDPSVLIRVNGTRVLHFVLKVQAPDGKWAKGGEYKEFTVQPDFDKDREIEYATAVYLGPGNYTLNLAVLDSKTGKSSLSRDAVRTPPITDDPFPELDASLVPVEFPKGFPERAVGNDQVNYGELFPVSRDRNPIPIANPRPVVIDIVLDISKRPQPEPVWVDSYGRPHMQRRSVSRNPIPSYDLEVGRLLQVGSTLARFAPQAGCVRVSAVDALRMKTMLDKADVKTVDWPRFEEQIRRLDQDTVDVTVLTNKKGPAQFTRNFLDTLSADSPPCGNGGRHYVIIVSHELPFPSKDGKLADADRERARFYYIYGQTGLGFGDDLGDLLKPVKPERLSFNSPRDFRKALAKIVSDLKSSK